MSPRLLASAHLLEVAPFRKVQAWNEPEPSLAGLVLAGKQGR